MTLTMRWGAAVLAAMLSLAPQVASACRDDDCGRRSGSAAAAAPVSILPFWTRASAENARPKKAKTDRSVRKTLADQPPAVALEAYHTAAYFMTVPPAYLALAVTPVAIVSETELNDLDRAADEVRIVAPHEINEVDLAIEQRARLAAREPGNAGRKGDDGDDELFNRILMTFAGALAAASAMRIFVA
ncbi:MAG: hypothetical protein K8H87_13500 [Pseudorhodoplanes sp.]|nr:hypothetical protein [Pseudorhodoplanes sp.]